MNHSNYHSLSRESALTHPVPSSSRRRFAASARAKEHAVRSFIAIGLAALLAASLVQATPAAAAGALVSQGKPVTASSSESAAFPATAAVDGNAGTRWSSGFSDPQWLQVDLGAAYAVDQVRLNW